MPENENDSVDRLEILNRKLFSKNPKSIPPRRPGVLHDRTFNISRDWSMRKGESSERPPMIAQIAAPASSSFFKKLFFYSVGFLALALVFAFFVFYRGSNSVSADNIDISILGNTFTAGGEDLQLQLALTNKNAVDLQFADLVISYPKGANDPKADSDLVRIRESIGTLGGGKSTDRNIKIVLYGEQGSQKDITATLEYRIPGSNAIFTKETKYSVTISSAPLNLAIDAPASIASNQDVTLTVTVTPNGTKILHAISVKAEYPPGFQFKRATPEPSEDSTVWNLGDLAPGVAKTIAITGTIFGQDDEDRSFRFYSGEPDPSDATAIKVVYGSLLHTVTVARPFIDAHLIINGVDQPEYSVASKNTTQAAVQWVNNSPARVENVEIRAKLSGNALDRARVTALSGFYNSSTNEIVWNRNTVSQFAAIEPGESGTLTFSFASLGLQSGESAFIDNPTITIEINMKGTQTIEGSEPVAIDNAERKTIKVSSDVQIAAQAFHATGAFVNTGPVPPRADVETTYTILWTINNSANPVTDALAKTTLPTYVKWLGNISPSTENVSYNEATHEVTWRIGQVPKGAGSSGGEKDVAFKISLTPSLSQVGTPVELVGQTSLSGTDTFTGATLSSTKGRLTSELFNDPGFPTNGGTVMQ